ncbi:uncharacterized protein KZ484_012052 [Pholidichthys leucotaenia]
MRQKRGAKEREVFMQRKERRITPLKSLNTGHLGGAPTGPIFKPRLYNTSNDFPQQNDFNQEEVLDEQQLLHLERKFIVVQVGADCSQIKEEQEDVCISREEEQFGLKQETQTFDEDV